MLIFSFLAFLLSNFVRILLANEYDAHIPSMLVCSASVQSNHVKSEMLDILNTECSANCNSIPINGSFPPLETGGVLPNLGFCPGSLCTCELSTNGFRSLSLVAIPFGSMRCFSFTARDRDQFLALLLQHESTYSGKLKGILHTGTGGEGHPRMPTWRDHDYEIFTSPHLKDNTLWQGALKVSRREWRRELGRRDEGEWVGHWTLCLQAPPAPSEDSRELREPALRGPTPGISGGTRDAEDEGGGEGQGGIGVAEEEEKTVQDYLLFNASVALATCPIGLQYSECSGRGACVEGRGPCPPPLTSHSCKTDTCACVPGFTGPDCSQGKALPVPPPTLQLVAPPLPVGQHPSSGHSAPNSSSQKPAPPDSSPENANIPVALGENEGAPYMETEQVSDLSGEELPPFETDEEMDHESETQNQDRNEEVLGLSSSQQGESLLHVTDVDVKEEAAKAVEGIQSVLGLSGSSGEVNGAATDVETEEDDVGIEASPEFSSAVTGGSNSLNRHYHQSDVLSLASENRQPDPAVMISLGRQPVVGSKHHPMAGIGLGSGPQDRYHSPELVTDTAIGESSEDPGFVTDVNTDGVAFSGRRMGTRRMIAESAEDPKELEEEEVFAEGGLTAGGGPHGVPGGGDEAKVGRTGVAAEVGETEEAVAKPVEDVRTREGNEGVKQVDAAKETAIVGGSLGGESQGDGLSGNKLPAKETLDVADAKPESAGGNLVREKVDDVNSAESTGNGEEEEGGGSKSEGSGKNADTGKNVESAGIEGEDETQLHVIAVVDHGSHTETKSTWAQLLFLIICTLLVVAGVKVGLYLRQRSKDEVAKRRYNKLYKRTKQLSWASIANV